MIMFAAMGGNHDTSYTWREEDRTRDTPYGSVVYRRAR